MPRDHPGAVASTALLVAKPIWVSRRRGQAGHEDCVAGFGLALSSWFTTADDLREQLVSEILAWQLDDGGWNCAARDGDPRKHSSFHTTIKILEGLREYSLSGGTQIADVEVAEARAREFFCAHHLYQSHLTGRVPDERMTRLPFPPRWHHDVLRGLDYFRAAAADRDPRLDDAISLVEGPPVGRPMADPHRLRGQGLVQHGVGAESESLEHAAGVAGDALVGRAAVTYWSRELSHCASR